MFNSVFSHRKISILSKETFGYLMKQQIIMRILDRSRPGVVFIVFLRSFEFLLRIFTMLASDCTVRLNSGNFHNEKNYRETAFYKVFHKTESNQQVCDYLMN